MDPTPPTEDDAETDGEVLWTETHEVAFDRGYYAVTLGSEEPLDDLARDLGV